MLTSSSELLAVQQVRTRLHRLSSSDTSRQRVLCDVCLAGISVVGESGNLILASRTTRRFTFLKVLRYVGLQECPQLSSRRAEFSGAFTSSHLIMSYVIEGVQMSSLDFYFWKLQKITMNR